MRPIMRWDSSEPFDNEGRVVWWSRLDDRYQIEVVRVDTHHGMLRIFDHSENDNFVHEEPVGLLYGALYGPDAADVAMWQQRAITVVDS